MILALLLFAAGPARAATVAASGQLSVPSDARVMVISTDSVMQQVLSEDFAVARRSKAGAHPDTMTLTVAVIQRVLEPTVSMISVAPGVPRVAQLLKAAGYQPPLEHAGEPLSGDAAAYVAQGNPSAGAYKGYPGGSQANPMGNQLERMSPYSPGPPPPPDPRDPRNRPIAPPDYLQPKPGQLYDTAVIAHAVLSDGKGEMTVVAVAQPGEDLHAVKKQLAERIANVVLH
ncbi:MAG TPA: hypothetical protein VGH29_18780 [Candidatus Binataceae bacterium]